MDQNKNDSPARSSELLLEKKKFNAIVLKIKSDKSKLVQRANRTQLDVKFISYLGIKNRERKKILEDAIRKFESSGASVVEGVVALSICFLKSNHLYAEACSSDLYKIIQDKLSGFDQSKNIKSMFDDLHVQNQDDDFIGAFYQSIRSIASKSAHGSYYTSIKLKERIKIPTHAKVIDPCCGSGSILLKTLDKKHHPNLVWARNIDTTALLICRVNLATFFNRTDINPNIEYGDILF